jgi:hypothetical protein
MKLEEQAGVEGVFPDSKRCPPLYIGSAVMRVLHNISPCIEYRE